MQPTARDSDIAAIPLRFLRFLRLLRDLQAFVLSLFIVFGVITSPNDVIIPKLKAIFEVAGRQHLFFSVNPQSRLIDPGETAATVEYVNNV